MAPHKKVSTYVLLQSEIMDTIFHFAINSHLNSVFSEGYVEENFERWEFKEGLEFKDQDLGLGIVCNRPNEKTLECNSVDNERTEQNKNDK